MSATTLCLSEAECVQGDRIEFWVDVPENIDAKAMGGHRQRLLRVAMRRWSRRNGLTMRETFCLQFTPSLWCGMGQQARARFLFVLGPDLSSVGGEPEFVRSDRESDATKGTAAG